MAESISETWLRNPDAELGERLELEVSGTIQADRVSIRPLRWPDRGYGYGSNVQGAYGFAIGPGYGMGLYGRGYYGVGTDTVTHATAAKFVAEDYRIRARTLTDEGNTGPWTDWVDVTHRPTPPAVSNLSLAAGVLSWQWSAP